MIINDDPKVSKTVNVDIIVDNLTVEQCSDVIVSLTHVVPDFKTVLRYDDLYSKPSSMNLEKRVKFQTPIFYLKKEIVRKRYSEEALDKFIEECLDKKR